MAIKDALLDQLLEGYQKPEDLLGEDGIFQEFEEGPGGEGAWGRVDPSSGL